MIQRCEKCKIIKPLTAFGLNKKNINGRKSICKTCYRLLRDFPSLSGKPDNNSKAKQRLAYLSINSPLELKARQIRSRLLSRVKDKVYKDQTPKKEEILSWLKSYDVFYCFYSGEPLDIFNCDIDHKIPLYRGGENDIYNLCLCTSKMNKAKGDMTDLEFLSLLSLMSSWPDKGESVLARLRRGYF